MKNYPLYETTVFEDFRIMVENVAERCPDKTAFSYRNDPSDEAPVKVTFSEVRDIVRDFGTALIDLGCRGERCAIIGGTSIGWIYTYFALMASGAVTVPIDKDLHDDDIARLLEKAECRFAFYSSDVAAKVASMRKACPDVKWICMMGEASEGDDTREALTARGRELFAAGDNSYYDYEIDVDALASIVFTSGTTGKGKGVMLSQRNITSDMT